MITLRHSQDRGLTKTDWLDSRHTFSFGDYDDPKHVHFGALRVINEDVVAPGAGFPTHPHQDMEIITYIIEGALAHKDSMGNASTIKVGEVQRMSAGTGVLHSEYNPSPTQATHLLQIWIMPEKRGLMPSYEQKMFLPEQKQNRLTPVVSKTGQDGTLILHQNVEIHATLLSPGVKIEHTLKQGHKAWIQVVRGEVKVNGTVTKAGDGVGVEHESTLILEALKETEALVFDLG